MKIFDLTDNEFISLFLADVRWYASGDNAQVYSFSVLDNLTLALKYNDERGQHILDFDKIGSLVTLGGVRNLV